MSEADIIIESEWCLACTYTLGLRKVYCSDNRGRSGFEGDDHCFFSPLSPGPNRPSDFSFGLLLVLDRGILSIYVNGRREVTIKRGLSGYYCWTAFASQECPTVKIERAPVPVAVPDA